VCLRLTFPHHPRSHHRRHRGRGCRRSCSRQHLSADEARHYGERFAAPRRFGAGHECNQFFDAQLQRVGKHFAHGGRMARRFRAQRDERAAIARTVAVARR